MTDMATSDWLTSSVGGGGCPTWMDVASSGDADLSKRHAADLTGLKTNSFVGWAREPDLAVTKQRMTTRCMCLVAVEDPLMYRKTEVVYEMSRERV